MRSPIACVLTAAVLTVAGTDVPARELVSAPRVRVFDAGELTLDRYTVIERLWTGTWRASIRVPTHGDVGSAIAALTSKAESLGADGVVNLHCVNDAGGWGGGYFCYGLAIKLR